MTKELKTAKALKVVKTVKTKVEPTNFKEGQKKPTPPESDSIRKFYTTLFKQNKGSEMALKWCLEHGCLGNRQTTFAISYFAMKNLSIK